jgi:hypothetical protein
VSGSERKKKIKKWSYDAPTASIVRGIVTMEAGNLLKPLSIDSRFLSIWDDDSSRVT